MLKNSLCGSRVTSLAGGQISPKVLSKTPAFQNQKTDPIPAAIRLPKHMEPLIKKTIQSSSFLLLTSWPLYPPVLVKRTSLKAPLIKLYLVQQLAS